MLIYAILILSAFYLAGFVFHFGGDLIHALLAIIVVLLFICWLS
jgi:hypothetical protein